VDLLKRNNRMIISIIAAIGKNRELGKNNKLLWHIPEDIKRFKKLTTGHAVIMGQRTFKSIGKLLPNRTNIILTHEKSVFSLDSCLRGNDNTTMIVVSSIKEAIKEAKYVEKNEVFVIGGGMIYKQFLPLADKLYLTIVESEYEADTFFPEYLAFNKIISKESLNTEKYKLTFLELERPS